MQSNCWLLFNTHWYRALWWAGCTASPMVTAIIRVVGIPCASAASLLDISHSECDALTGVCCYVGWENMSAFLWNCFFLEEQGSCLRGRRETLKFTVSLLWCSACRHHFCICSGGHQIKAGLGTHIFSDVTLWGWLCVLSTNSSGSLKHSASYLFRE